MDDMASATQMNANLFPAHIRPDRAVLRISGDGALIFLNNLLTMELNSERAAYGALLTPQGKILHDVFVVPSGNDVFVDCASVQAAELLKRLMMYRLRAKLEIVQEQHKAVAVSTGFDLPSLVYQDPRISALGYRSIVELGALPVGGDYDTARITQGIANSVLDIGSGEMFAHEANLDQLNGVSFTKGCYVGQEVVSRTQHRSTARNRILPVAFSAAISSGAVIVSGDQRIGTVLSTNGNIGLALIRLDRLAEVAQPLLAGTDKVSVRKPGWAEFEVIIPQVAQ